MRFAGWGLLLAACGSVAGPPPSPGPVNGCSGPADTACNAYAPAMRATCQAASTGYACLIPPQTGDNDVIVFVVSFAEDSRKAPGQTFLVRAALVQTPPSEFACTLNAPPHGDCWKFPDVNDENGVYEALPSDVQTVQRYLGNPGAVTTLPVRVMYRAEIIPPKSSVPVDATLLNLPIPPIVARLDAPYDQQLAPMIFGPGMSEKIGWDAIVPDLSTDVAPTNPMATPFATYRRIVSVIAPFDDAFPPYEAAGFQANGHYAEVIPASGSINPVRTMPFAVTRDGGSLAGFTFFLEDESTGRVISSRPTLGDGTNTVSLYTTVPPDSFPKNTDLVIAPPAGAGPVPQYADAVLLGAFPPTKYPVLPAPVQVSGVVQASDGSVIAASLHFRSTAIENGSTLCDMVTMDPARRKALRYELYTTTIDPASAGGQAGTFAATLPPGDYDVIIEPTYDVNDPTHPSGYAKQKQPSPFHVPCLNPPVGPPVFPGQTLTTSRPFKLQGSAFLTDARPLAAADVDLTPAASLWATLDQIPESDWPRPAHATTGAAGDFSVDVDPGIYDITVRPLEGTRFPWVVSPSVLVTQDTILQNPVSVPAPTHFALTLHDFDDQPVVRASVRAFAFPATGGPALEIGRSFTDEAGHFDLYVTPLP